MFTPPKENEEQLISLNKLRAIGGGAIKKFNIMFLDMTPEAFVHNTAPT